MDDEAAVLRSLCRFLSASQRVRASRVQQIDRRVLWENVGKTGGVSASGKSTTETSLYRRLIEIGRGTVWGVGRSCFLGTEGTSDNTIIPRPVDSGIDF